MDIDRKYQFLAINPCSRSIHTQNDAIIFLAKDKALPAALQAYRKECLKLGSNPAHLESIDLLISRVVQFQKDEGGKVPDTDLPCEIRRCIEGEGVK